MDDGMLAAAEHRRALAGLARINRLSQAAASIWRGMAPLLAARGGAVSAVDPHEVPADPAAPSGTSFTVLDLATGSGDVAVGVARLARRAGVRVRLHLVDFSPLALAEAAERAKAAEIDAVTHLADVVKHGLPLDDRSVDAAMCSLFLHHLDEPEVIGVLRELARVSRRGLIVSDLRRCRPGLIAAGLAGRLLTRSPVVRVDAVRSVRAAWTEHELAGSARAAGLQGCTISGRFPFRMQLLWSPS
jgi:SAM-dependent methyltransferase